MQRAQRVHLMPHDPRWSDEFAHEASLVVEALGEPLATMHHIGSTAIPGIHAKPIIDMLLVVAELALLDERSEHLQALGYEALGEYGIPGRRYFRKNDSRGDRTHQIHAFQTGSPQVSRHLAFRDYLRAHPDCASAYDSLKHGLAALYPHDISRYTDGKDAFIAEVDALAAAWRAVRGKLED